MYKSKITEDTNSGGDMEKQDLDLLNRIYQDARIGMQSIDKVLKKSTNENLNKLLRKQF